MAESAVSEFGFAPVSVRARAAAEAVGDEVELLRGGIRRGSDVAKALAHRAQAVVIGRAYLWGLAAHGHARVENVLDPLRDGLGSTLIGLGQTSIADPHGDDLVIPPGFERRLGTAGPAGARRGGRRRASLEAPPTA